MKTSPKSAGRWTEVRGFTLIELLVVVGVVLLLGWTLIPARAASRGKSQSLRCMDNLRELMAAVNLYTLDNHDFYPPNPDDGNTMVGHNWCAGQAGMGGGQECNPDILADPTRCLIAANIKTNVGLFHCPGDLRFGRYQGADPAKIGTPVPAARSMAMNGAVGTVCPSDSNMGSGHSGKPGFSVNGPWLNNNHSHRRNTPWRTYGKVSETLMPGPARLWVLIEEAAHSLNDAVFSFGINTAEWIDFPATRHSLACTIAFADGRVELRKWADPRTPVVGGNVSRRAVPDSADWLWLSERTSARAQ